MSGLSAPNTALIRAAGAPTPWWRTRWFRWVLAVVIAAVLIAFPLVGVGSESSSVFADQIAAKIAVFAVAVLGLNVVMGYTGQVSLGQPFFIGVGAYTSAAVIMSGWGSALGFGGVLIGLVLAVAFAGVVGYFIALAAARLRGLAIAMVTIALPLVGAPLAKRFPELTGGAQGEYVNFSRAPEWTGLADDQWQYYLCVVIAAIVFALVFFLVRGKYGRAFAIVKSNEAVASAMGISPYRTKVLAMTIAAMIGGVAGFLYLIPNSYVSPDIMSFGHSIELVIATIVGGSGSIVGSIIGGAYYVLLPIGTNAINPSSNDVVEGIVILATLFLLPGGLASLPRVLRRLSRRRDRGHRVGPGAPPAPDVQKTPHQRS